MSPEDQLEARRAYAESFNASPTMRYLGAHISLTDADRVLIELDVEPHHRGGKGTDAVNGGILAALFDLALGCTAALVDASRRSATMQLSMSFERAVEGDRLVAEAWVDRAGGRVLFSSAVIRDAAGITCARAQGVMRLSDLPWAGDGPGG